jgi:hypothetical protein
MVVTFFFVRPRNAAVIQYNCRIEYPVGPISLSLRAREGAAILGIPASCRRHAGNVGGDRGGQTHERKGQDAERGPLRSLDPQLAAERRRARLLIQALNETRDDAEAERARIIRELIPSVVTKDIPAAVFAAGNPCRVIRPIGEGGEGR